MSNSIVNVNVSQQIPPAPSTLQRTGALISQGGTVTSQFTLSLLTQFADLTPLLTPAKTLASLTWSGSVVTAVTSAPHGFTTGDSLFLTIAGAAPSGYNGSFLCTITSTTQFTYALTSNPGSETIPGTYIPFSVGELTQMATSFFAQGNSVSVKVLELGPGNANDGITALGTFLQNTPNIVYSFLVPRFWASQSSYQSLVAGYENNNSKTYFFTTMNLTNYVSFTALEKCVFGLIEAPKLGAYPSNALTAISYSGGTVTATTTTAHNVAVGDWITIAGCTPAGYNGIFQAQAGTTGSTLVYSLSADPGAETILGTLVANYYASAAIPSTEFSCASGFYKSLSYNPSSTNLVTPFQFSFLFGVTPFPTMGLSALLTTLKGANVNIVGTGAQGGLSDTILLWGTMMDGNPFNYWYSVDWMQINVQLNLTNEIINGSNDPVNPLFYNQNGINRLQGRAGSTASNAISYGLALGNLVLAEFNESDFQAALDADTYAGNVVINAEPFPAYSSENPDDYKGGIYTGLTMEYTPQLGFEQITFNIVVTEFV